MSKRFGRQKGAQTEVYRGQRAMTVNLLPKVKVEITVRDGVADEVVAAIVKSAKTGSIGDGKVFVWTIDKAVRIRTGRGEGEASIRSGGRGPRVTQIV